MSPCPTLLVLFLLCSLFSPLNAQAESLTEQLYLRFLPPNGAARAITPISILFAETPIVVRYTLIGAIAIYEPQAACQPKALSFFGVRDKIRPEWCKSREANAILQAFTLHRALSREFPQEAENFAVFLRDLGLEPVSNSSDRNSKHGWANFVGDRISKYFVNDGWNSLGDRSTGYRRQFADYTGYRPENCATDDPERLRKPLRWQPMVQEADGRGRFVSQIHVVPQLGTVVKPLVLSAEQVRVRRVQAPYSEPNRFGSIGFRDVRRLQPLLRETMQIAGSVNGFQRFLARWWNNKLLSTASISSFYETEAGLSRFEIAQQFMGEMLSQHDALLVAWREKRRHDVARPRTILRFLRRGQSFRSFLDEERGFGRVKVEDWRPVLDEQPHSEYPSGSAALCTAAMEHIETYVGAKLGGSRVPPLKLKFRKGELPFFMSMDRSVSFRGPGQAAQSCGESRLWAGVHFRPAVVSGNKIGRGIGKLAFAHIKMLERGVRPAGCERCL